MSNEQLRSYRDGPRIIVSSDRLEKPGSNLRPLDHKANDITTVTLRLLCSNKAVLVKCVIKRKSV